MPDDYQVIKLWIGSALFGRRLGSRWRKARLPGRSAPRPVKAGDKSTPDAHPHRINDANDANFLEPARDRWQRLASGQDSATGKKMVPGIPSSVIELLVLRRGAPNRIPATIRLARKCGVTRVVSANDEKSPPSLSGLNQKDRDDLGTLNFFVLSPSGPLRGTLHLSSSSALRSQQ
jgi:hypothetical protein